MGRRDVERDIWPYSLLSSVRGLFVAIRDVIVKSLGFADVLQGLERLGIEALEIAVDRELRAPAFGLSLADPSSLGRLASALEERGVAVCAVLLQNDFGSEDLAREVEYVRRGIEIARELGASVVRVDASTRLRVGQTEDDLLKATVDGLRRALEGASGVWLAVENHGLVTNRVSFLRRLLDATSGLSVGLTLDTGNLYWYGYPLSEVYEIYDELSRHVRHTHVKNARAPPELREARRRPGEVTMAPLYEGDIDLRRAVEALASSGYDHDLTIEDESLGRYPLEARARVVARDKEFLEGLIESV